MAAGCVSLDKMPLESWDDLKWRAAAEEAAREERLRLQRDNQAAAAAVTARAQKARDDVAVAFLDALRGRSFRDATPWKVWRPSKPLFQRQSYEVPLVVVQNVGKVKRDFKNRTWETRVRLVIGLKTPPWFSWADGEIIPWDDYERVKSTPARVVWDGHPLFDAEHLRLELARWSHASGVNIRL